jgi:sRNA-binding regulator protein Hfq
MRTKEIPMHIERDVNPKLSDKTKARSFKHKSPTWSHQRELSALKGQRIALFMAKGGSRHGTLKDVDQFTVKIVDENDGFVSTIFKHAFVEYCADPAYFIAYDNELEFKKRVDEDYNAVMNAASDFNAAMNAALKNNIKASE